MESARALARTLPGQDPAHSYQEQRGVGQSQLPGAHLFLRKGCGIALRRTAGRAQAPARAVGGANYILTWL